MKEELTAGGKEFVFVLFWAAVLYLLCGCLMSAFGSYASIGGIISVLIFAAYGFFVLTRYTARFTYEVHNGRLRINRMIGKRNKEVEFACSDITNTYYGFCPASFPRKPYNMRKSMISKKQLLFIEYRTKDGTLSGVVIEPTDKLRKRIEKERKKTDND